ncbi:MAG TPA: LPS export ABC transporter periplasmic protein LptC [Candidatus Krumholzibacteria bacterium]|nr:LPS export ABC transporter periplasmic protein LptC [Candidatus Krumholzibacteria bacterium]HPD71287.1 LPS export ABC transporter periplasmic protein LptC [Candidatus Krumholzibacteria bacterium]HRY39013.1 LPS export ABC transporter periplasmic protein LptC [Candidatus Krumholzibacteria bacterium]
MAVHARRHCRGLVALLAGAGLLAAACQETPPGDPAGIAPAAASGGPQPEQRFFDYRLIETKAGVKLWTLDSSEMLKYAGRQEVELVRVKMDFFRDGAYFSTLVSDSGTANLKTNDVFVWGHVVVTTADGRRLRTSELAYASADGRIRNDVYNVLDRGEDVVTGFGLEATPDLDYIEIKQNVAAEVGDETVRDADSPGESP